MDGEVDQTAGYYNTGIALILTNNMSLFNN